MNAQTMPHSGRIILPLLDNNGAPMPHDALVRSLADTFGGVTASPARGAWIARDGRTDDEPVVVYAISSDQPPHRLLCAAAWVLSATLQDAVFVEIDGAATILHR
ncbi:hypothetical protein [Planktothrix phage Pra-JY27]|nr:SAM lyase [Planktothrix phage Pag-Yong1]WEV89276.1 molybdenum cofactor biosynthesis protein [Synechococcus phage MinM2]